MRYFCLLVFLALNICCNESSVNQDADCGGDFKPLLLLHGFTLDEVKSGYVKLYSDSSFKNCFDTIFFSQTSDSSVKQTSDAELSLEINKTLNSENSMELVLHNTTFFISQITFKKVLEKIMFEDGNWSCSIVSYKLNDEIIKSKMIVLNKNRSRVPKGWTDGNKDKEKSDTLPK